jgi:hypothetical protein
VVWDTLAAAEMGVVGVSVVSLSFGAAEAVRAVPVPVRATAMVDSS